MIRSFDTARIPRDEIVSLDRAANGADVGACRVYEGLARGEPGQRLWRKGRPIPM